MSCAVGKIGLAAQDDVFWSGHQPLGLAGIIEKKDSQISGFGADNGAGDADRLYLIRTLSQTGGVEKGHRQTVKIHPDFDHIPGCARMF